VDSYNAWSFVAGFFFLASCFEVHTSGCTAFIKNSFILLLNSIIWQHHVLFIHLPVQFIKSINPTQWQGLLTWSQKWNKKDCHISKIFQTR
jgi:hypothetical protein